MYEYLMIYEVHMSAALNASSAIWHFERSNAIEIHNGITFDFYMGLPHMVIIIINKVWFNELVFSVDTQLFCRGCLFTM